VKKEGSTRFTKKNRGKAATQGIHKSSYKVFQGHYKKKTGRGNVGKKQNEGLGQRGVRLPFLGTWTQRKEGGKKNLGINGGGSKKKLRPPSKKSKKNGSERSQGGVGGNRIVQCPRRNSKKTELKSESVGTVVEFKTTRTAWVQKERGRFGGTRSGLGTRCQEKWL